MNIRHLLYYIFLSSIIISCAPSRFVKPLEKGQSAVSLNVGGGLFKFGSATIPMPLSALTYGYGLKDKTTVYGSLHTTALLFGVGQVDLGMLQELKSQKGWSPAITISPSVNLAMDRWKGRFKVWPQLDLNVYWHYNQQKSFVYTGMFNWFDVATQNSHRAKTAFWIWGPMIGHTLVRPKMNYNIELKYIAPNRPNDQSVVEYKGINKHGAIGIFLTAARKF